MTYYDVIKQALAHLEYGTDEASMDAFIERFMIYANDAVRKIALDLRLEQEKNVQVEDGEFVIDDLNYDDPYNIIVTKVVSVKKDKRLFPFVQGTTENSMAVLGAKDGMYTVRYRYLPDYEGDPAKEPAIPSVFHPILYLYIVHCHHNTRSTASDYDRTKWYQEFNTERRRIMKQAYGALNTYAWTNRPWETGEM